MLGKNIRKLWRYIEGHWRGQQGLTWSFWVNFVFLRALVSAIQEWFRPESGQSFYNTWVIVLLLVVFFHGVLFVWQFVGVIRASETHVRNFGSMASVWGSQLALVFAFFWVLSYVHDASQMVRPISSSPSKLSEWKAERASKYSFEISEDGKSLALTGSLELGITDSFKQQLDAHPQVKQIVLDSTGGNIFQARGLSKTIQQNGLSTLVAGECSSACTIAFIGGVRRQIAKGGKLGFHQYRVDADYAVLNANPKAQQDRDRKLFLQAGVEPWFIDKMFQSQPSEMWYPEQTELLDAHVITRVMPND